MKTIKRLPLLLAFVMGMNLSLGQETDITQKYIDSILNVLPSQEEKTRFKSYIQLNHLFSRKDPKQGKVYLEKAEELAKKSNDNKLLGLSIHQKGNYYSKISQFKKA